MIIEIDKKRLAEVTLYAYKLNKIKQHQCRPFSVRMSYEDIYDKFNNLIDYPTDKLLASINKSNQILGVLGIFTELDDKYLQAQGGIYAHENYLKIGNEFMHYLKKHYHGNKMVFGFPKENLDGIELMKVQGFILDEDAIVTTLYKNKLIDIKIDESSIVTLNDKWHEKYLNFSKLFKDDRYWTGEKILTNLNKWQVNLLIKEEEIIGAVEMQIYSEGNAEIFSINVLDEYKNEENIMSLIYTCSKNGFDGKIKQIIMFVNNEQELNAVKKIGFKEEDTHLSYSKIL